MNKTFTLLGQEIRWSYYHRIVKLSGNHENAQRFFLRATQNKANSIVKWIMGGIGRNGYCWNACSLETENPGEARRWINDMFNSGPTQLKHEFAAALRAIADDIEGGR